MKGPHQPPSKMSNRTRGMLWCQYKEKVVLAKVRVILNLQAKAAFKVSSQRQLNVRKLASDISRNMWK